MQKENMKNVILAIALVVGLGVMGFAATAQAAEVGSAHTHKIIDKIVMSRDVSDHDGTYHIWHKTVYYFCSGCDGFFGEEIEYEIHDYENVYDDNGHMILSYCTICGSRDTY